MATSGDTIQSQTCPVPSCSTNANTMNEKRADSYSSDSSVAGSEEFYDAVADEHGNDVAEVSSSLGLVTTTSTITTTNPTPASQPGQLTAILTTSQMADSGIYSMHSSHVDTLTTPSSISMTDENKSEDPDSSTRQLQVSSAQSERSNACPQSDITTNTDTELISKSDAMPRPPPRTRKKRGLMQQNSVTVNESGTAENSGNNSSSADSRSMTNSVESTTASVGKIMMSGNPGHNLTSILDDIVSIKGDLSITEVDDKKSVYIDGHPSNGQMNLKNSLIKPELIFSHEQLKEISKSLISSAKEGIPSKSPESKLTGEALNQIMIMDIDTGEKLPLGNAENLLPKCLNPLSLHLMKLTNDYDENEEKKENSLEKDSSNIADTTFKSVTSLISNTLNDLKSEIRDKSLDKKAKKKLKEMKSEEINESLVYDDDEDDDENEEKNNIDLKDGRFRSKFRDLKKLGSGLIRGVKGVKASAGKERSTFHVDLKSYSNEPEPMAAPAPPRYKLKVNHKRGNVDFDQLKSVQEINDCKGAIWCMKFSNCSQLLAAAGQDHMLRVYCAQKSWKYFTQLRNKASGQHISPNSTKERSSVNGDSFGRVQRSSFSRSGSLNANDSHNNSSSSSSSSAFAKEMYRDEDNTLSEEGPLLLFTIYRGHTADVLDLAWSKNHFLLSASMDKTVRLWHITRIECLCTFRHIDFVTTIQFHPRDDRFFLSGSLDGKLRLWNIPDKRVTLWNEVNALPVQRGNSNTSTETDHSPTHGLITASSFVQNGKFAVIGTYDGRLIFYTTDQLKYFTQIHVSAKSTSTASGGQSRKGRINKVTGIESVDDNNKILVTTNDSRLRLYDLRDLSLTCKYKGCINQSSQIKAAISHDHRFIICGSENNSFYIWRLHDNTTIGQRRDRNKQYECIRLLNPQSPASVTSPVYSNESTVSALAALANQPINSKVTEKETPLLENDPTLASTAVQPSSGKEVASSVATGPVPSGSSASVQQQQPAQPSNAATKIVTSAIFAPVPGQIDEKAKYVIAIADFNGYIRIFSKHEKA